MTLAAERILGLPREPSRRRDARPTSAVRAEIAGSPRHALGGRRTTPGPSSSTPASSRSPCPSAAAATASAAATRFAVLREVGPPRGRRAGARDDRPRRAAAVRWGTPEQQDDALAPVAADGAVLTAALHEPSAPLTAAPRTRPADAGGFALTGVKTASRTPAARTGSSCPATVDGGPRGARSSSTRRGRRHVTGRPASGDGDVAGCAGRRPAGRRPLCPAAPPRSPTCAGSPPRRRRHRRRPAGRRARADREHVRTREQFGRRSRRSRRSRSTSPTSTSSARRPPRRARRVDASRRHRPRRPATPSPTPRCAAWVVDEDRAAIGTCHHLHGGLGLDRSYPLHRFSAPATDLAHLLGGGERALEVLADTLFGEVR
jgi:alkylation response protein AidB-like acyl-CoA dehydrogenase